MGSRLHLDGRGFAPRAGCRLGCGGLASGLGKAGGGGCPTRQPDWPIALLTGAGLGFLAGLTGIGGGVFLTPLLLMLNWTPAKVAGGVSALFIVVNSVAGLVGLAGRALVWQPVFAGAVALGIAGLLGTQFGVKRWHTTGFRRALALVLWIAAAKLALAGN